MYSRLIIINTTFLLRFSPPPTMLRITSSLRSTQLCFMNRKQSSVIERARQGIRDSVTKTPTKEVQIGPTNPVVRHGPGDGCITLNVGGKEFQTLRSTVFANEVLAKHVVRAEANQEITKSGAVFIDRDPGVYAPVSHVCCRCFVDDRILASHIFAQNNLVSF